MNRELWYGHGSNFLKDVFVISIDRNLRRVPKMLHQDIFYLPLILSNAPISHLELQNSISSSHLLHHCLVKKSVSVSQ